MKFFPAITLLQIQKIHGSLCLPADMIVPFREAHYHLCSPLLFAQTCEPMYQCNIPFPKLTGTFHLNQQLIFKGELLVSGRNWVPSRATSSRVAGFFHIPVDVKLHQSHMCFGPIKFSFHHESSGCIWWFDEQCEKIQQRTWRWHEPWNTSWFQNGILIMDHFGPQITM